MTESTSSPGRNAPCPCGSGKKYKRCCLRADEERRALGPAEGAGAQTWGRPKSAEGQAEVRGRFLRETLRSFYTNWADEPLPALDGRTPREAIATPDGLEAVTSLLETYRKDEEALAKRQKRDPLDFGFLWDELGLSRPGA